MAAVRVRIGPERIVLPEALQSFMFRAAGGRLVVTAQLPVPLGTPFPGVWASAVSDDGGESWRRWEQGSIAGGSPFHEGCGAALPDGGTILLQWEAYPGEGGAWRAPLWESRDGWRTVEGPFPATLHLPDARPGVDDDGHPVPGVFLHRTLLPLPDGSLLMTAYGWFEGDDAPSTYRPSMKKFRSFLLRSADRGRSWEYVSTIAVDPAVGEEGYNEPVLARVSRGPRAGRLIAHLRTGSNKTYRHCPIHQAVSEDGGRTWTTPAPLPWGNVDPELLELSDGTLVAAWGWRTWESRVNLTSEPKNIGEGHGNYLALSRDGGESWEGVTRVTGGPSTCYVSVREVAPGRLAYVYDVGDAWQHVWIGHEGIRRAVACRMIELET